MDRAEHEKDETLWEDTQWSGDISTTHPFSSFCEVIPLLNVPGEQQRSCIDACCCSQSSSPQERVLCGRLQSALHSLQAPHECSPGQRSCMLKPVNTFLSLTSTVIPKGGEQQAGSGKPCSQPGLPYCQHQRTQHLLKYGGA